MKILIFALNLLIWLILTIKGITTQNDGSIALGTIALVTALVLFAFIQAERKL